MGTVLIGWNGKFLIPHINKILGIIEPAATLHFVPDAGKGTIATKNDIVLIFLPLAFLRFTGIYFCSWKIYIPYFFIKAEFGSFGFGQIDHPLVKNSTGNGPNGLPFLAIFLIVDGGIVHVHGTLVHRNGDLPDFFRQTHFFQGPPTPITHRQIDRSARKFNGTDIRSSVKNRYRMSKFSKVDC